MSQGRLSVHFITGGSDHEQAREGDRLTKDQRYARTREYIQIVKRAWTSAEPFDHHGEFYDFDDFVLDAKPFEGRGPTISFGGSSEAAYRVGAAEADIFAVWGEPLASTAEQIARIHAEAAAAGRTTPPRIHAAFRPIIAPTEELAWEKAHRILDRIEARKAASGAALARWHRRALRRTRARSDCSRSPSRASGSTPRCGRRRPRRPAAAGNSNALVGTPETVAQALLAYYDLGVRIVSARGYDLLDDAIDFGRYVIPIVKDEVAKRDRELGATAA